MTHDGGDLEKIGGSSEKKGRIVARFVGILLGVVLVLLILVIGYLKSRKEKSVPVDGKPATQSEAVRATPFWYA